MNSWVLLSFPTKRACVLCVSSGTTACSIDERLLSTSPRSQSRQVIIDSVSRYVAPRTHDHGRKLQKVVFRQDLLWKDKYNQRVVRISEHKSRSSGQDREFGAG